MGVRALRSAGHVRAGPTCLEPPCPTPAPPWPGPENGWQACPVSAAPGLTQPGFTVEYRGWPLPQDVPSTCLVLRLEQSSGWPGHCPLTHGAHCVWPGSGNSLISAPPSGGWSLLQPCAHGLLLLRISRPSLRQQESAAPQPITNISCLLVGVLRGPFSTHEGTQSGLGCCGNP